MATMGYISHNFNNMRKHRRITMGKSKKKDDKPMPGKPGKKGC
jgi:hypothetical protein